MLTILQRTRYTEPSRSGHLLGVPFLMGASSGTGIEKHISGNTIALSWAS